MFLRTAGSPRRLCCFGAAILILAGSLKAGASERLFDFHITAGETQDTFKPGDPYVYVDGIAPARDFASAETSLPTPEFVATDCHPREVEDAVTPLIIRSPDHVQRAPYATTQDALQSVPIVSRAGPSEVFDAGGNFGRGTSIHLRGLAAGATLTLFNGHRLAWSGANTDFMDVSSIPVSVIERVDVLPNGASALYGSDAVAGVLNIIPGGDLQPETHAEFAYVRGIALEQLFRAHGRRFWFSTPTFCSLEQLDNSLRRCGSSVREVVDCWKNHYLGRKARLRRLQCARHGTRRKSASTQETSAPLSRQRRVNRPRPRRVSRNKPRHSASADAYSDPI